MTTKLITMGSCSSRTIFNSEINKDYKKFFNIIPSLESVNLISLMSAPIDIDLNLIKCEDKYDMYCITNDFSKTFLNKLITEDIEYIIWDTYFDSIYDVIRINEQSYLTNSPILKETKYYNDISSYPKLNIKDNFKVYFPLWKKSCTSFFKFIEEYCDDIIIALNLSRPVYKYYDKNHNIIIDEAFKELTSYNQLRNILDKYVLENFDVEILPFDENTLADENHFFKLHPTHYEQKYYEEKNNQLIKIIKRNSSMDFNDPTNRHFRKSSRENILKYWKDNNLVIKDNILNYDEKKLNKEINKPFINYFLSKYNTARIDLKNNGNETNSVQIATSSDPEAIYEYPAWFKDSDGEGLTIKSQSNFLNLEIECVGKGILNIVLKSINKTINEHRIPIYLNYTKFFINEKCVFNEQKIASHDNPYTVKINVKDKQKINIYIEWMPLY